MKQKLIACAGMNRSGSTWQFNAVRTLLDMAYPSKGTYSCWVENYESCNPTPFHVVKVHTVEQVEALSPDTVITSHRDLRAVAGSLIRMRWAPPDLQTIIWFLENYVKNADALERIACYDMPYEKLLAAPFQVLGEIASALNLRLERADMDSAQERLRALKPPDGPPTGTIVGADATTLLHRGHVGDATDEAAIRLISPALAGDIGRQFSVWLERHGYKV